MKLCITLCWMIFTVLGYGQGLRGFIPIATPDAQQLQEGQRAAPADAQPVSRRAAEQVVRQLVEAWNNGELAGVLSDSFYDKSRLVDTLEAEVPRDARLVLLSLQSVQTLRQHVEDDVKLGPVLVSRVSAVAQTQVEFNDPQSGEFVRREGENEFIFIVKQRAR